MSQKTVTLVAAGDIQFDSSPPGLLESDAVSLFKAGPLNAANLEMVLSSGGHPQIGKAIRLRTDPKLAPFLKQLNCRVLSFANNHSLDFEEQGLLDTLQEGNKLGLQIVGAGKNIDAAKALVLDEVDGLKVSFVAFSCTCGPSSQASSQKPGIFRVDVEVDWELAPLRHLEQPGRPPRISSRPAKNDLELVKREISDASKKSDIVVVMPHWGVAFTYELTDYQRELAHELVDSGAHLVIGSHPHIIQAMERYKSGLIFYSLGNFIFQHQTDPGKARKLGWPALYKRGFRECLMAKVPLSPNKIGRAEIYPMVLNERGVPSIAQGREAENILETLKYISELEETSVQIDSKALRAYV